MSTYILRYSFVSDYLQRRDEFREEHLNMVQIYKGNKNLLMAGALENPSDEAILVFEGEDDEIVKQFAKNDPYVKNSLVTNYTIRKWNLVS